MPYLKRKWLTKILNKIEKTCHRCLSFFYIREKKVLAKIPMFSCIAFFRHQRSGKQLQIVVRAFNTYSCDKTSHF